MERIFRTIPMVLGGLDASPSAHEAVVLAEWRRIAGAALNERTRPLSFRENRLVVAVENDTWRNHLEHLTSQMLARLNGDGQAQVKFIEFRTEPNVISRSNNTSTIGRPSPSGLEPTLREAALAIADESLRTSFLDAAATYLARKEPDSSDY
jgi:hypothetical protein